jgi:hypothetical protein
MEIKKTIKHKSYTKNSNSLSHSYSSQGQVSTGCIDTEFRKLTASSSLAAAVCVQRMNRCTDTTLSVTPDQSYVRLSVNVVVT